MRKIITKIMIGITGLFLLTSMLFSCNPVTDGNGESSSVIELTATATSMESISVEWKYTDTSKVPAYYDIYVCETGTTDSTHLKRVSDPEVTSYKFYPLTPDTEYNVIIRAFSNESSYENIGEKTISATTKPLQVPELEITDCKDSWYKEYFQVTWAETGYSFTKQELYLFTDADLAEGETAENYEISGKTPVKSITKNSYPTIYSTLENKTMEHVVPFIQEKTKHYFKLVCYNEDDSIFGSKLFTSVAGVGKPHKIDKSRVSIKSGIHSSKVTIDLTDIRNKYTFDKLRFEINDYKDKELVAPFEVDVSKNTDDILVITIPDDISKEGNKYLYITSINESGERKSDYISYKNQLLGFFDENQMIVTQTSASIYVPLAYDYIEDDVTLTYTLRDGYKTTSNVLFNRENMPVTETILFDNLYPEYFIPEIYYYVTAEWTTENNEKKSYSTYRSFFCPDIYGFDAPKNLTVIDEKTTSTSVTLKFDELTEEQKFGKTLKYFIFVYDNTGKKVKSVTVSDPSSTVVSGLTKGKEYTFKVYATTTSYASSFSETNKYPAILVANTSSGVAKPVIKNVSYTADTDPLLANLSVEWDKVTGDTGNIKYTVEYKIFKGSNFRKSSTTFSGEESFTKSIIVNGGNRYIIRVSAYKTNDPTDISYSDEQTIQLPEINDTRLYGALIYTSGNTIGATAGSVVDLSNNKIWIGEGEIRSDDKTGYNFGCISFLQGEYTDPLKYGLPTGETAFCSVKMSYAKALDSVNPRVILMDRSGQVGTSNYASFNSIYLVKPDVDGTIINTFETSTDTDGNKTYLSSKVNMPFFGSNGTRDRPSTHGLSINEDWVFNNSIYIGVVQQTQGYLGFSYYY